jgi:hypothetical protein
VAILFHERVRTAEFIDPSDGMKHFLMEDLLQRIVVRAERVSRPEAEEEFIAASIRVFFANPPDDGAADDANGIRAAARR